MTDTDEFCGGIRAQESNRYRVFTGWNADRPDSTKEELVVTLKHR
jgi:hypothetical protein